MRRIIIVVLLILSSFSATCNIALHPGWSLISVPFPEVLESEIRSYLIPTGFYQWDTLTRSYEAPAMGTDMNVGSAYWALSDRDTMITITYDPLDACIDFPTMFESWNMMGAPYNSIPFWNYELKYDRSDGSFVFPIFSYNPETRLYDGLGESDFTEKGKGYWILASDTMTNDSCFQFFDDGELLWEYENEDPLVNFRTRCSPALDDDGNVYCFTERTPAS